MSKVTTISLCDETYKIAKKMDNFSKFVRSALLVHAGDKESLHTMTKLRRHNGGYRIVIDFAQLTHPDGFVQTLRHLTLKTHKCDPFSSNGQCVTCWPPMNGPIELQLRAIRSKIETEECQRIIDDRTNHLQMMEDNKKTWAEKYGEEE